MKEDKIADSIQKILIGVKAYAAGGGNVQKVVESLESLIREIDNGEYVGFDVSDWLYSMLFIPLVEWEEQQLEQQSTIFKSHHTFHKEHGYWLCSDEDLRSYRQILVSTKNNLAFFKSHLGVAKKDGYAALVMLHHKLSLQKKLH